MEIKKKDYDYVTNFLIDLSQKASRKIMEIYNNEFSFKNKNDKSPITLADLYSHKIIVESLKDKFGGTEIISEESINKKLKSKNFFLIDPLDGTKEFIKKNDEFTVNIAYLKNLKPIISVITIPAKNIYYFTNGFESFKTNNDGKTKKIISRSNYDELRLVVSRSHLDVKSKNFLNKIENKKVFKRGSSLKFCMIAEGEADLYLRYGKTMEWDIAAGHAILKNANANLLDFKMKEIFYKKKNFINPSFLSFSNTSSKKIKQIKTILNKLV